MAKISVKEALLTKGREVGNQQLTVVYTSANINRDNNADKNNSVNNIR